jgi:hypothetical protein
MNEIDDIGQALIESYFTYRDEWEYSALFRCSAGHLMLAQSCIGPVTVPQTGCSREGPCGQLFSPYQPNALGLTQLQWAKKLLRRQSDRIVEEACHTMRQERVIAVAYDAVFDIIMNKPATVDECVKRLTKVSPTLHAARYPDMHR